MYVSYHLLFNFLSTPECMYVCICICVFVMFNIRQANGAFTDHIDLDPIDDVSKFLAIENHVSVLKLNTEKPSIGI